MRRRNILISLASLLFAPLAAVRAGLPATARDETEYDAARNRLAIAIRGYARMVGEQDDPKILRAIAIVPRHLFVPIKVRNEAYEDYPLSIGADQTISQPSLVALMTHLLRPRSDDTMLEIGTGSGYQAAILSHLVARVFSVEIVGALAKHAAERLRRLGNRNVEVRHGDGYLGWPEHAPFDGIIVTAGAAHVPQPLLDQLKRGGRMVIPIGRSWTTQRLTLIEKDQQGRLSRRTIASVRFVPLTRKPSRPK
jgi:protein-L-isoaspartate(D-aspartate) O-methyltransferase